MATAAEKKRQEERVKLIAQAVSNIGTACIVTGAIAPILLGRSNALAVVASFAAAAVLYLGSQRILHYVVQEPRESAPWSL